MLKSPTELRKQEAEQMRNAIGLLKQKLDDHCYNHITSKGGDVVFKNLQFSDHELGYMNEYFGEKGWGLTLTHNGSTSDTTIKLKPLVQDEEIDLELVDGRYKIIPNNNLDHW